MVSPIRKRSDVLAIMRNLKSNKRDYALFVLGVSVGLRASDLLAIRWSDVVDEDGEIRRTLRVRESKTKKHKSIVLGSKARQALKALMKPKTDLDSFVFRSRQNGLSNSLTGMSVQNLNVLVKKWCKAAKVKGSFGSHSLRKTFAFHILKKGGDLGALMKLLNHSSAGVTLRYCGIEQDDLDRIVLKLNW